MPTTYEIPLSPDAQTFLIALAGVTYTLSFRWCAPANAWVLDIADALGVPMVRGIPLVADVDLLAPYAYLNFGGQLIAQTDNVAFTPPTYANLGVTGHLYFTTP